MEAAGGEVLFSFRLAPFPAPTVCGTDRVLAPFPGRVPGASHGPQRDLACSKLRRRFVPDGEAHVDCSLEEIVLRQDGEDPSIRSRPGPDNGNVLLQSSDWWWWWWWLRRVQPCAKYVYAIDIEDPTIVLQKSEPGRDLGRADAVVETVDKDYFRAGGWTIDVKLNQSRGRLSDPVLIGAGIDERHIKVRVEAVKVDRRSHVCNPFRLI